MEPKPIYLGCHLSSAKGYAAAGRVARSIGANTFQFFTRNPRGGNAKSIDPADANELMTLCRENAFGPLVAHAPYTLNPASSDERVRDFALRCMQEDIERMEYFPGQLYNLHPGSHVERGIPAGIRQTCDLLNESLKPNQTTTVLLETMSGHGSELGGSFEEIAELLFGIHLQNKVGVCLDTCHVYSAGYDIKNDLDGVLETFDRVIGLNRLFALHLNDSLFGLGSRKDRHARVGEGTIGLAALRAVLTHEALRGLPVILETPNEPEGHGDEIRLLRQESQPV